MNSPAGEGRRRSGGHWAGANPGREEVGDGPEGRPLQGTRLFPSSSAEPRGVGEGGACELGSLGAAHCLFTRVTLTFTLLPSWILKIMPLFFR